MRNGIVAALVILLVIVSTAAGYSIGVANQHTNTVTTSATTTIATTVVSRLTTISSLYEPCNTEVWNESFPTPYMQQTPVLLMRPNSTGFVCVTFQSAWRGNQSLFLSDSWILAPYLVNGTFSFKDWFVPMNWECKTTIGTGTCEQILPHSFLINVLPSQIHPSGGMNYLTIVYSVTALSNSTGFYDVTAPWTGCLGMPMAVGYSASQLNASDFTRPPPFSCFVQPFLPVAEYATGMNVTYINFIEP